MSEGELSDLSPCKADSETTINNSLPSVEPLSASVFSLRQKTKELCTKEVSQLHESPGSKQPSRRWIDVIDEEEQAELDSVSFCLIIFNELGSVQECRNSLNFCFFV